MERERRSFWSSSCFHWFFAAACDRNWSCSHDWPLLPVALADPESSVFMVFPTWTSKWQHFLVSIHVLVCSAPIPKHQHPWLAAEPPSLSHTHPSSHSKILCRPRSQPRPSWWVTLLSLVCVSVTHVSWNILSCERGFNNAAGKDQTYLSSLLPDQHPNATWYPIERLLLGCERSHITLPRVVGTNLPEIP